jgi:uncharacterized protein (TIGR02145 family)
MAGRVGPIQTYTIIGTQKWMLRNLDVITYRNGDTIPQVTDPTEWSSLTTGAWCYYNNDPANGDIYGKLYNWYAVNDPRGLAPEGYHVPNNDDWTTLINTLGGFVVAGGELKEAGTSHWAAPNTGATNSSKFTALPGGSRDFFGTFDLINLNGFWWSSTEGSATSALSFFMSYNFTNVSFYYPNTTLGFSVRCIKD